MDPQHRDKSNTSNGFLFNGDDESFLSHDQSQNFNTNGINHHFSDLDFLDISSLPLSPSLDNFTPSTNTSFETESPDDQDSDPVLKFLNQILVEEDIDEKPSMFHDPLALRNAEKSLYEVIGQKYPPSPYNADLYLGDLTSNSPESFLGSFSENTTNSSNGVSSGIDPQWLDDPGESNSNNIISAKQSQLQDFSADLFPQVTSQSSSSSGTVNGFDGNFRVQENPFANNTAMLHSIFSDTESILQFKRGMEEASKFLPTNNQLVIDLDKYELPPKSEEFDLKAAVIKEEKGVLDDSTNGSKGRKHQYPENGDFEELERRSKQSAVYVEDVELSELMDKLLLCGVSKGEIAAKPTSVMKETATLEVGQQNMSNGVKVRGKKKESKVESVDLRTLLISCAQSVAVDDRRTAYEQLKQIKEHSSPSGDVYQRLAHVFAAGLEARLCGTGGELYASFAHRKMTAVEKLKAYQMYLSASPFKKLSYLFANKMIDWVASEATTLHIIDFGILYGFQWPVLIQLLSERINGPPKLRITGIEFPQSGFRPTQSIEETGVRLSKYCERFNVPFEYQAIAAQNWEKINVEDLKIRKGEVLAVNCFFRFNRMLDETVSIDSPRDALLKLIREIKPDIFVNAVTNGSFNTPFFVTRFRETLFHYLTLFDMFDTTLSRDCQERMNFEQDFYGREVINVIACEGTERVERPETYKQWQVRHVRAGFKPFPLNREIMKKLRHKVATYYHKDFLFDEDGNWMLQGWKGRIVCASSCWVPS